MIVQITLAGFSSLAGNRARVAVLSRKGPGIRVIYCPVLRK